MSYTLLFFFWRGFFGGVDFFDFLFGATCVCERICFFDNVWIVWGNCGLGFFVGGGRFGGGVMQLKVSRFLGRLLGLNYWLEMKMVRGEWGSRGRSAGYRVLFCAMKGEVDMGSFIPRC